jgi:hypothetical protein
MVFNVCDDLLFHDAQVMGMCADIQTWKKHPYFRRERYRVASMDVLWNVWVALSCLAGV